MPAKRPSKKARSSDKPAKRPAAGSGGSQSGSIARDDPGSNPGPATNPPATKRGGEPKGDDGLTPKQRRFVDEYLIDLDASAAAVRAGYSQKTRAQLGYQLLQNPSVSAAIQERAAKREQRTQITADMVLSEFYRIARVDFAEAFDEKGDLKPVHEIPEDIRRAIAGFEVESLFDGRGEDRGQIGYLKKVKFWDKNRALEALAKHLGLLIDRSEVEFKTPPALTLVLQQVGEPRKP